MGWYVMAIVDILDFLPRDHARRDEIIAILNRTIEAIARVQDADTGVWYQVLDNPSPSVTPALACGASVASREAGKQSPNSQLEIASPLRAMTQASNYLDSSASCMFVYAMVKGARNNYLPPRFLDTARRAYDGIIKQFVQVDATGQVHLTGTCRSAGLGGTPYRDGSFEYYVSEPAVTDNHHGVGAFILAATEMERVD